MAVLLHRDDRAEDGAVEQGIDVAVRIGAALFLVLSVTVLATRDGLRAWTIMLSVLAFSMSMVGTFLVRSGILTSVHA